MEIFGIGPMELAFIALLAIIVLGPKDMVKAGRTIGRFLRKVVTSPAWKSVTRTSQEIRNLPTKLIREAGIEEEMAKLQEILPEGEKANKIYNPGSQNRRSTHSAKPPARPPTNQPVPSAKPDSLENPELDISAWITPPDPSADQATNLRPDQS